MTKNLLRSSALALLLCSASVSCTKDGGFVDPDRPFNTDAVELCISYIGMDLDDAVAQIREDWNFTATTFGETAICTPHCESIKATSEYGIVYRVEYERHYLVEGREELAEIAAMISDEINAYYTEINPSTYNEGSACTSGDSFETFDNHDDLEAYMDDKEGRLEAAEEYWEPKTFLHRRMKHWKYNYNDSRILRSISFCVDSGKQ